VSPKVTALVVSKTILGKKKWEVPGTFVASGGGGVETEAAGRAAGECGDLDLGGECGVAGEVGFI
jgi:hypothetical protein